MTSNRSSWALIIHVLHDEHRMMAVELAKRQLIDVMWKTANIEVDGITFPDTQEIFEGRAPANMAVDDIIVVNNIKRAWMFLFENVDQPIDWQYVSEYNRILGEGLIRDAGKLRTNDVRIGGTLHYYESNDDVPFRSWLKDNAIERLPGGITSVESRRLELKRSGTATVDQNLPVYQTAMSMRAQTPAY